MGRKTAPSGEFYRVLNNALWIGITKRHLLLISLFSYSSVTGVVTIGFFEMKDVPYSVSCPMHFHDYISFFTFEFYT